MCSTASSSSCSSSSCSSSKLFASAPEASSTPSGRRFSFARSALRPAHPASEPFLHDLMQAKCACILPLCLLGPTRNQKDQQRSYAVGWLHLQNLRFPQEVGRRHLEGRPQPRFLMFPAPRPGDLQAGHQNAHPLQARAQTQIARQSQPHQSQRVSPHYHIDDVANDARGQMRERGLVLPLHPGDGRDFPPQARPDDPQPGFDNNLDGFLQRPETHDGFRRNRQRLPAERALPALPSQDKYCPLGFLVSGFKVKFLNTISAQHHNPSFLGVGGVDKHFVGHG